MLAARSPSSSIAALCFASCLAGCGGSVEPATSGSDAGGDVASDGLADSSADSLADLGPDAFDDVALRGACPATLPPQGGACLNSALDCGYGDDFRPSCRARASCIDAQWRVTALDCASTTTPACPPESTATKAGAACSVARAFCPYADRTCECVGAPGTALRWTCDAPAIAAGCPARMPNLGTACTTDGAHCVYGTCGNDSSGARRCGGFIWLDEPPPCGV